MSDERWSRAHPLAEVGTAGRRVILPLTPPSLDGPPIVLEALAELIWTVLASPRSTSELLATLVEMDLEVSEQAVLDFLGDLQQRGAVQYS